MKSTRAKAMTKARGKAGIGARSTAIRGAKAPAKKVAKQTPKAPAKKVAKKTAKVPVKKVAKAPAKKVAKAPARKVAKTPARKVAKTPVKEVAKVSASAATVSARAPLTPLAATASSGVSSSGATARGPSDGQLRAGDDLPPLSRRAVSRVDIARYCAASGDFNVLALDEPRARDAGLPQVVVPGGLAFALADACLASWLGNEGRVVKLGARLVKMLWPDDEPVAHARVSEVRDAPSGREVDLDVWVENQKGELILRGQATCSVAAVSSS